MRHLTVQQISGSLDGALSGVSLELVVRHLSSCRECRERHARLTKQDDALRRLLACEFPEVHFEDMFARLGVVLEAESRGEMTPEHALPPDLPPLAPEPSRSREMPRPPSQQLPNPALLSEEEQKRRAAEALKEAEAAAMASLENLFRDLNAQKHGSAPADEAPPAAPDPVARATEPAPEPAPEAPRSLIALPPDVLSSLRAAAPEPAPEPEPVAEEPAALQWTVIEGPLPVGPELPGEIEPHVSRAAPPDHTSEPVAPPEPEVASEPVVTPEPVAMPEPEVASEPVVTPEPVAMPESEVASEPVVTPEPVAPPEPEVASEPVATPEPVAMPEPEMPAEAASRTEPIEAPVVDQRRERVEASETATAAAPAAELAAPSEPAAAPAERPRLRLLERARLDSPALPREPEDATPPPRAPEPLALVAEREPQRAAPRPRAERVRVPRRVVLAVSAGVAMLAGVIALSYMPPVIRVPVPELPRPRVPRIEMVKVPVGAVPRPATAKPAAPVRRAPAAAATTPARTPVPATPIAPVTTPAPRRDATPANPPPSRPAPARIEAPPIAAEPRHEAPAVARPAPPPVVAPARPAAVPVAPPAAAAEEETADDSAQWPLLCGVVVDDAGAPVAGARIALADLDLGARTDRRGHFCLAAPPGDRTLSVLAAGFATHRRIVSLGAQTLELSIALTPAP